MAVYTYGGQVVGTGGGIASDGGGAWAGPYSYVQSDPYSLVGEQPYQFQVYAPNGPVPDADQPLEVWPLTDGGGHLYFYMDVSAASQYGQWTNAQLQAASVAALDINGFTISTFTPIGHV